MTTPAPNCTCDPTHTDLGTYDKGCPRHDTTGPLSDPPRLSCPICRTEHLAHGLTDEARNRAAVEGPSCCAKTPVPASSEGNADQAPGTNPDDWRTRWRTRIAALKTWPFDPTDLRA